MDLLCRSAAVMLIAALLLLTQLPATAALDGSEYVASSDTISYALDLDAPFTTNLPATLNDSSVDEYRPIQVPAESWTVGRSFYWTPSGDDEGEHELVFVAQYEGASIDTLVLMLDVQPE